MGEEERERNIHSFIYPFTSKPLIEPLPSIRHYLRHRDVDMNSRLEEHTF